MKQGSTSGSTGSHRRQQRACAQLSERQQQSRREHGSSHVNAIVRGRAAARPKRSVLRSALEKVPAVDVHDDGTFAIQRLGGDVHVAEMHESRLLGNP